MARRPDLPPTKGEDADAAALYAYLRWYFRPDTAHRSRIHRVFNRARNYRASNQWL